MENNLFEDMPGLKYFPDLQVENRGHAGWYQNELKNLVGYGIGMFLLAGKLARISILTGFV